MGARLLLLALALVGCKSGSGADPAPATEPAAAPPPGIEDELAKVDERRRLGLAGLALDRVGVIGASMSDGFGGAPFGMILEASTGPDTSVQSVADTYFFQQPLRHGPAQVDRILAFEPDVVFALDFLFWYVYVAGEDQAGRMARLERGLAELERIEVPVVVGDLPDMRNGEPWMLSPAQVPPPEQLAAFNQRIRAWGRERPSVAVVPLAEWARPLLEGGTVAPRPGAEPVATETLMNGDGLHPNREGALYVFRLLDRMLEAVFPDTAPAALSLAWADE
jgi:hypothetical protein